MELYQTDFMTLINSFIQYCEENTEGHVSGIRIQSFVSQHNPFAAQAELIQLRNVYKHEPNHSTQLSFVTSLLILCEKLILIELSVEQSRHQRLLDVIRQFSVDEVIYPITALFYNKIVNLPGERISQNEVKSIVDIIVQHENSHSAMIKVVFEQAVEDFNAHH